jgi:hypothetical protein
LPAGALVGWSCGGSTAADLEALPVLDGCIETSGSDGQFEQFGAGGPGPGRWSFCGP